jgi:LPXTG-motif cell wall-anchored protein
MTSIRTARRLVVLGAATSAVLLGASTAASADAVTTTTGQTLRISVGGGGLDQPQLVAYGTARVSPGTATIRSVTVRINRGDPIPVELDPKGHFRKGVVLAFDPPSVEIEAIATASDGSTVNALVIIGADGSVTRPDSPDKGKKVKTMPNTGASDPSTLGPIGLAMVILGSGLVWRYRQPREV